MAGKVGVVWWFFGQEVNNPSDEEMGILEIQLCRRKCRSKRQGPTTIISSHMREWNLLCT